jgi:acetyl-CoA carboxylase/biotin carboxylase 1
MIGGNTCGIVVFKIILRTPEYNQGRAIIVIANDITYQMGSFGPEEDLTFLRASQLARELGLPRIYLSANSGARIGLADEVLSRFKIAWINEAEPQKGFDYLYLEQADYENLNSDPLKPSVTAEMVTVDGKIRYRLTSIIGQQDGLGVENLHGSGEIAGETSQAYQEIFTLTMVSCRSVGIGAYLVRLGQRVIQVEYAPIILTGAGALNKVLGRQVYASNLQLGGTRIMYQNGVSHTTAQNDFDGVLQILDWLSFVPEKVNSPLPIMPTEDPTDRDIEVKIPGSNYDPRVLIEGGEESGSWKSGLFDRGSFRETLGGWAKGVVVGRARLGGMFHLISGIPMGVIAVETRSTETVLGADPAVETSQEETIKEAGQVWYPNSAFKTAQAIRDFNHGEQLPLMILANWRGFSGGQSDMSKEVLKFGAQIVDALREYKQPIFVYIIGELRGGAWVVVDPSINPQMMEMYASENARGGVLEPTGIVEIKYRTPKILAAMSRLDGQYQSLWQDLKQPGHSETELAEINSQIIAREKLLLPIYQQVAVEIADLHDRPQRMLGKNVIQEVVEWQSARRIFYWKLLCRINEQALIAKLMKCDKTLNINSAREMIQDWFRNDQKSPITNYSQDFVEWMKLKDAEITGRIAALKENAMQKQIIEMGKQSPAALIGSISAVLSELSADEKSLLLSYLGNL